MLNERQPQTQSNPVTLMPVTKMPRGVTPSLKFNCGCGYRTQLLFESAVHVKETGHTMTVHGLISVTEVTR